MLEVHLKLKGQVNQKLLNLLNDVYYKNVNIEYMAYYLKYSVISSISSSNACN